MVVVIACRSMDQFVIPPMRATIGSKRPTVSTGRGRDPRGFAVIALCAALAACANPANPYEKFYRGNPLSATAEPSVGAPRVATGSADAKRDMLAMFEDGYILIGTASFADAPRDQQEAVVRARKVAAAFVLIYSKDPAPDISGSRSAVGGGQISFGTYSFDRHDLKAAYYAPMLRSGLGVYLERLWKGERGSAPDIGSEILAVRRGSPGYAADLLPGDIILFLDGLSVGDGASVVAAVNHAKGHDAKLVIVREGRQITKSVFIPDGLW